MKVWEQAGHTIRTGIWNLLTNLSMSIINAMFKAVEFIERNFKEDITIRDIADTVVYSVYHLR